MCYVNNRLRLSRADKEIILQNYTMSRLNFNVKVLKVVMDMFMEIFLIPFVREWVLYRTLKRTNLEVQSMTVM